MFDFHALLSAEGLVSLVSLTVMEIVLGIDNVLLVAILSQKVKPAHRAAGAPAGHRAGAGAAHRAAVRADLADGDDAGPCSRCWATRSRGGIWCCSPGGLFLIYKATHELYERIERAPDEDDKSDAERKPAGSVATVLQILALDVVFSLDSVITAVGMARAIIVMMAAMIIAVGVMFAFAGVVSEFVNRHPSMKILALAFLLLIGVLLTADAFGHHINRGYVYFAMAFSLVIELLNMRFRKKTKRKRAI